MVTVRDRYALQMGFSRGFSTGWLDGTDPVSYTHLDVYKRQFRNRTKTVSWNRDKTSGRPWTSWRGKSQSPYRLSLIHISFVAFAAGLAETGAFPVAEALLAVLGSGIGLSLIHI